MAFPSQSARAGDMTAQNSEAARDRVAYSDNIERVLTSTSGGVL
jgi:hypothetical protein